MIDSAPRLVALESGRGQSNAGTLLGRFQKTAISPNDRTPSRSVKQISPVRYVSFISYISMHQHIIIPRVVQDSFIGGNLFSIYHAHAIHLPDNHPMSSSKNILRSMNFRFRWRGNDAAVDATVPTSTGVRKIDRPTDTLGIHVSNFSEN